MKFKNRKDGFESLLARIRDLCRKEGFARVVVGMEPTGHYWKPLANWLGKQDGIDGVIVNTYDLKLKRRSLATTAKQSATRRMR